ncbi:MAG: HNH endonuclease [Actinomycetota bacterium]|nr:HNH endonuclease [Actinomycetota bacterium]
MQVDDIRVSPADVKRLKEDMVTDRIALRDGLQRAAIASGAAERDLLRWVLRCDRAELWHGDGGRNMAQWLSAQCGISNWKARRWIGCAHALEHLPHLSGALETGVLSLDKTVELARFATPATDKALVKWAAKVTVATIRSRGDQEVSKKLEEAVEAHLVRHLTWSWSLDGDRLRFEGDVPADQGITFTRAIDKLARELPAPPDAEAPDPNAPIDAHPGIDQRRADALVLLATAAAQGVRDLDRTELVLHASVESLAHDHGNPTFGGHVIHPETARRLTCDARLQVALEGDAGKPLGIGDRSQIIPRWLRRQVMYRDSHTCGFPGCEMRRFLTPHHVDHWIRRGPSDLPNLVMLCPSHHTLVHEHRWSVVLDATGSPVWFRPSGRRYEPGRAPPDEPPPLRPVESPNLPHARTYSRLLALF